MDRLGGGGCGLAFEEPGLSLYFCGGGEGVEVGEMELPSRDGFLVGTGGAGFRDTSFERFDCAC